MGAHERTGRLLGQAALLATLEQDLGRILRRQKPGPKRKAAEISMVDLNHWPCTAICLNPRVYVEHSYLGTLVVATVNQMAVLFTGNVAQRLAAKKITSTLATGFFTPALDD